jgi:hypothetical protein
VPARGNSQQNVNAGPQKPKQGVDEEAADHEAIQLDLDLDQAPRPNQPSGVAGIAFERALRNQIGQRNNNSTSA